MLHTDTLPAPAVTVWSVRMKSSSDVMSEEHEEDKAGSETVGCSVAGSNRIRGSRMQHGRKQPKSHAEVHVINGT